MQVRQDRGCDLGRHSSAAEQLLIDEVATEEHEIGAEGASFSDDALEAGDVIGMRAGVKIRKEDHSERTGPSLPTIDCELHSANPMRPRPRNPLKPTLAAEFVSEGWPRDGADQTTSRTLPNFPVIPTPDGVTDDRPLQAGTPFQLRFTDCYPLGVRQASHIGGKSCKPGSPDTSLKWCAHIVDRDLCP